MSSSNAHKHLNLVERKIIETGIHNGSSKAAIAQTLGKDKSTIGKEIKNHRILTKKCTVAMECAVYQKCRLGRHCTASCTAFVQFTCSRRDRSPGACNGCKDIHSCHFDHYMYRASEAENEYKAELVNSRSGINITEDRLKEIGEIIEPLIKKGLAPYSILQLHPEIGISEKTMYFYIESGAFRNVGINLIAMDLRRQTKRAIPKKTKNLYKPRNDRRYLKGRLYTDFEHYMEENPAVSVVEMDTVYNDVSNGPFMQTFRFLRYHFTLIVYHEARTAEEMYKGVLFLEEILGVELFDQEVNVIKTDRGSEFSMADAIEMREDGTRRTRVFYCDPMRSGQKGSLENSHESIRYICPKETDLYALGLTSQGKASLITSHINSFPKEKLNGKTPFQLLQFLNASMYQKLHDHAITEIAPDKVILKPYLLK